MVHAPISSCTVELFWSGSFLAQEGIEGIKEGRTLALDYYFSCDALVVYDCCVKLILFVK